MAMAGTHDLRARITLIDRELTGALTLPPGRGPASVLALALAHSGDSYIWAALTAAAWFLGDTRWRTWGLLTFTGLVLAEIVVIGIKFIVRRKRPPGTAGRIYRRADPYSFPSGHAARATMLCILAWKASPLAAFVAVAAWSPFMVIARVAIGIHYVSDVLAGIALGGLLAAILLAGAELLRPLL
jgi:undecaprenyl-diphosphatase